MVLAAACLAAASLAGSAGAAQRAGAAKGAPKLIASDTVQSSNPVPFWGQIECASQRRHEVISVGGDPHPTWSGAGQGNDSFRRLHLLDGDDFYGERCELGNDNRRAPTAFYREGKRRITSISLRLPQPGFDRDVQTWQVVMQMKQVWPAANSAGTPVIELGVHSGRWVLAQSRSPGYSEASRTLWTAPARGDTWTRFNFNVRYSKSRRKGQIKITVDLNGDLDYADAGERPRKIRTFTLKREIRGGGRDGLKPGASISSHLRTGIYHDPGIRCDPPGGCIIDVDNVQVVRP